RQHAGAVAELSPLSPVSLQLAYLANPAQRRGRPGDIKETARCPLCSSSTNSLSLILCHRVTTAETADERRGSSPVPARGEIRETILIVHSDRPLLRPTETDALTWAS